MPRAVPQKGHMGTGLPGFLTVTSPAFFVCLFDCLVVCFVFSMERKKVMGERQGGISLSISNSR